MVARQREYHILPRLVRTGDLLIGHVIDDLKDLTVLNDNEKQILSFSQDRLWKSHERNVVISGKDAWSCESKLLSEAAAAIISGTLGAEYSDKAECSYFIREMVTTQVKLSRQDYLDAVAISHDLQEYLQKFGGAVYMVTGIKTCKEKSIDISKESGWGAAGRLGFEIDSVNIGLHQQFSSKATLGQKMDELADCIFAIKVTKLTYKRKYKIFCGKDLVHKGYNKGAELAGAGDGPELRKADDFDVTLETDVSEE